MLRDKERVNNRWSREIIIIDSFRETSFKKEFQTQITLGLLGKLV